MARRESQAEYSEFMVLIGADLMEDTGQCLKALILKDLIKPRKACKGVQQKSSWENHLLKKNLGGPCWIFIAVCGLCFVAAYGFSFCRASTLEHVGSVFTAGRLSS